MTAQKWAYVFGGGRADGNAGMKPLLGGKGANLAEMAKIGLPVPPGFTLTTEVCVHGMRHDGRMPEGFDEEIDRGLEHIEGILGSRFGDGDAPLLVSVRSGARDSMPGMMDTVLNIGLNDETVAALAAYTGDERFAWDCYRRFLQMYANVVMGVDGEIFESLLSAHKKERGVRFDVELRAEDWRTLAGRFRDAASEATGTGIPDEPREQLRRAIVAVFRSWNTPRAVTYRRIHHIPDDWGTAANVMAMVYGNLGDDCGTGVVFTRDPSSGENVVYGEFLKNAQGEDVVAGIRTPGPLSEASRAPGNEEPSLEAHQPEIYRQLVEVLGDLERHYRDVQDVEFTIEKGKLWILQTRSGKRTGRAAIRIALDLLDEGILTEELEALEHVDADRHVTQLLHDAIDPAIERPPVLVRGLAASPGAATGRVVFTADAAVEQARDGEVILVRRETSADDVHGMHAAKAILTSTGGLTSHAAVVARSMGVPCVAGAGALEIDETGKAFTAGGERVEVGEWITVDGGAGEAYRGRLNMVKPHIGGRFSRFMEIADRHRRLRVRANADTPEDALRARELGAEGIGLCRTEHMFFATHERLTSMRSLILADEESEREEALERLLPFQRDDFAGILRAMDGLPVTIRLLDPPLHEFLPSSADEIEALADDLGKPKKKIARRIEALHEQNPMLGFRGCRLGIAAPEIYRMQVRAILEAALGLRREGLDPRPEIMVPLVALAGELAALRRDAEAEAQALLGDRFTELVCPIGTMIELPRAALTAGEIARHADFFSFGTNDLTQTTFGLSRDDASRFLPHYLERGLLERDPFVSLDQGGVGQLVAMAVERGRAARPDLHLGICGEHGGDPSSIAFCEGLGLDYVSCSAFRVPGARLAAAQAAGRKKDGA